MAQADLTGYVDREDAEFNSLGSRIRMSRQLNILWHKASSWWFEFYLGIDTRGAVQPPTDEGVHYTPLPYPMIFRMLKLLDLQSNDVFVDIGCGKGRVVCCACRLPIRKVVAIELNGDLLDQAIDNAGKVRGRRAIVDPVQGSAQDHDYTDATVVYLYNPFNARITELVMDKLFLSYTQFPRAIRVVYANPVHETAMEKHGWLMKYDEWPASDFAVFGYPVSFWRS
jgi:predicted RNA methylase